ncbi:MAG: hypothetical protein ACUVTZ_08940 [Armatimonadota bacterium]
MPRKTVRGCKAILLVAMLAVLTLGVAMFAEDAKVDRQSTPAWDTMSDTWVATDALGRRVPGYEDVGPPRRGRYVGIFYFLWLGAHVNGGPYDITKILARDPSAINNANSPLWGPLYAPHHWGEPLFGYYLTDDAWVLRKHAQMLSDAGVDVVIFDVTNQVTYKQYYMALLKTFREVRASGGKTPQVAFLTPFWEPAKVVRELYRDLYAPGLYRELWFRWDGKPLILADPDRLSESMGSVDKDYPAPLDPGHTLGQSFTADRAFDAVGGSFPTWRERSSAMTLSLRTGGADGPVVGSRRFRSVEDNAWVMLDLGKTLPPGRYYLEMSQPEGRIGWWSHSRDVFPGGEAYADGKPAAGDRTIRIRIVDETERAIRAFFTFRKPQPDYFVGPTGPNQWSWLEVYPQHVFRNSKGEKEQMSVGVAQNAVGNRLASFTEPGARGRSFHNGAVDTRPDAVLYGLNFAEQFERALKEDPRFIFVTGWNEWIAGRFEEFNGVRLPVVFVDEFTQEYSRDIEPMKGGHGDNYYYQLVSYIRRFKGVRRPPSASSPKTIDIGGGFDQWADVRPEYRDDVGDTMHRDHPGWNNITRYVNKTGRNDFVLLKVTHDSRNVYFYAKTRDPITLTADRNWMVLFIDIDGRRETGWEGYDFVVNRRVKDAQTTVLEANAGGWNWRVVAEVPYRVSGSELMLAIPRAHLGLASQQVRVQFDFKWADNFQAEGDILDFLVNGDTAPNGRFNYRYIGAEGGGRRGR